MTNIVQFAKSRYACCDARIWLDKMFQPSAKKVWDTCEDGDWLMWLLGEIEAPMHYIISASLVCVEAIEHLDKDGNAKKINRLVRRYLSERTTASKVRTIAREVEGSSAMYGSVAESSCSMARLVYGNFRHTDYNEYKDGPDVWAYDGVLTAAEDYQRYKKNYLSSKRLSKEFARRIRLTVPWEVVEKCLKKLSVE